MLMIGRHVSRLSGFAPAVPTPFNTRDAVDTAVFGSFCDRQIADGATALVVAGTTGEASTLRPPERDALIRVAREVARGRVPVIAGAGSNSTERAIELTRNAAAAGADAVLSVVPYYNKPTQAGMRAHFQAIAELLDLPVILYDVPSRTGCGLAEETIARLAKLPQLIGLVDASADAARALRLRSLLGSDFRLFSGDDASALAFLAQGGDGCVSVVSNVAPGLCRSLHVAWARGQANLARRLAGSAAGLTAALADESDPGPLKYALSLLGLMAPRVRLPLVEPGPEAKAKIAQALAQLFEAAPDHLLATPESLGRAERRQG